MKIKAGRKRRVYRITGMGRKALERAKIKVNELHHELHEEHPRSVVDEYSGKERK